MRLIIMLLTLTFLIVGCQTTSSRIETISANQVAVNSITNGKSAAVSSIRKIDFQNFTFTWTKTFGYGEKAFALKNGIAELSDERKLSLKSLSYINVADGYDEEALVNVDIDDGNATYHMLYVFAIENNKPKLLESFEFGDNSISFGTAFDAHGELVVETYHQLGGDSECCPSVIEISYYKWQKNKFVLQGATQKIPNGYVERLNKKNEKN